MVRFLHTSDWQLGMRRRFLEAGEQGRFLQARIDAIRTLGRIANEHGCAFIVAAGDIFESNHLDPGTITRTLDALRDVSVPVYLLPGNHDPLDPASIFRSPAFREHCPAHVHVLEGEPLSPLTGVEVHGAPWHSKRPGADLVARACEHLNPAPHGVTRIMVAHGGMARFAGDHADPAFIDPDAAAATIAEGRIHYLALGDRHSYTPVDATGRINYSGAPEPTDYDETDPGKALVVDLSPADCNVQPVQVATWRFLRAHHDLESDDDLAAFDAWLDRQPSRDRTVLKLTFAGTLSLAQFDRLETIIDRARHGFAAVERDERRDELAILPGADDLESMALGGYAREALDELTRKADAGGEEADTARQALGLLYRLAGAST